MSEPVDLNQPNGPRETLVPLPRYGPVACPDCPAWEASKSQAYQFATDSAWPSVKRADCPACGGLRFVRVDVDSLRVWPVKEDGS